MIKHEERIVTIEKSYKIITLLLNITFTHIISIKSNQQSQFLSIRKWKFKYLRGKLLFILLLIIIFMQKIATQKFHDNKKI